MAALTDEQRDLLDRLFMMNSFSTTWATIDKVYQEHRVGEKMEDDERIAEYSYINQQLRKYISSAETIVRGCGSDVQRMRKEIENMISTAAEYADTRKQLMYNFTRDIWLLDLYSAIMWIIDGESEAE